MLDRGGSRAQCMREYFPALVSGGQMLRLNTLLLAAFLAMSATLASRAVSAQNAPVASEGPITEFGIELQGFQYPYPVAEFEFTSQRLTMHRSEERRVGKECRS